MALLLDTGPIYSSIDRSDPDHARVVDVLRSTPRPHLIAEPVLVEVDYWIRKFLDISAFESLVADIVAGRYVLTSLDADDVVRAVELEGHYADSDIGFVDASLVAVAERLKVSSLLTFDHRHFSMIKPRHRSRLELLPA